MVNELPIDIFTRATTLFAEQRWYVPGEGETEDPNDSRDPDCFDRFCAMLSQLNSEEIELVFQLTSDFLYCPMGSYYRMLKKILHQIPSDAFKESRRILLVPLMDPDDSGKNKSGGTVVYCAKALARGVPAFAGKLIIAVNDPRELGARFSTRCESAVIMCDDFIGTGQTAIKALSHYQEVLKSDDDSLALLSLVVQEEGKLRILEYLGGEPLFYYSALRMKGISDSDRIERDQAKAMMLAIEERLGVRKKMRLGYGQSEALVSMIRTPNNTFPIYWKDAKASGDRWPSPFPR
jgi:hypothetical protein